MRDLCSEGPSPAFSTPPAQLERQTLGRRMGCVVCSTLVGPSAGFLAAIQIIHRNQACKTRSHPLLLLQPTFLSVGKGLGWQAGRKWKLAWREEKSVRAFPSPSRQGSFPPQLPREQNGVRGISLHRWSGHMVQGGTSHREE